MQVELETCHWELPEFLELAGIGGVHGGHVQALRQAASRMLGTDYIFPVNSGRGALAFALQAAARRQPNRTKVLIPDYVCPAVPETVMALGLQPVPLPVDSDLDLHVERTLPHIGQDVLAIIPVHMYGHIMPLASICDSAQRAGVIVIDDAAHLIGMRDPQGVMPGTCGNFGLISFAESKTIACGPSGSGGLLLVNDLAFAEEATSWFDALPTEDSWADVFRKLFSKRAVRSHRTRLWRLDRQIARFTTPRGLGLSTRVVRITDLDAALALRQLRSLERRIQGKIRIAETYSRNLGRESLVTFPQFARGRYLTRVMLRLDTIERRDALRLYLAARGIATRSGYPAVVGHNTLHFPLLEVPSGYGLSDTAIARVVSGINAF